MAIRSIVVFLLFSPMAYAQVPSVSGLVAEFLDQTLDVDRLNSPHQLEHHIEFKFPDGAPKMYALRATYRRFAKPPLFRTEAILGPYMPMNQAPVKYESVWNGNAHVVAQYSPKGQQAAVTIARSEQPSADQALGCNYLHTIGIPCTPEEVDEAKNGRYFLRNAVSDANGYFTIEKTKVNGIDCWMVGNLEASDTLWFSVEKPVKLIKRDVWKNLNTPRRWVILYSDYDMGGFPKTIECTMYNDVAKVGVNSKRKSVWVYSLDRLEFVSTPDEEFVVPVQTGAKVLDTQTMTSFKVEDASKPPFSHFLKATEIRQSRPITAYIAKALFFLVSGVVVSFFWKRGRSTR